MDLKLDPVDVALGLRVRAYRMEKRLSMQTLGLHLGVTYQQIQKYETGRNRISVSTAIRIAKVLDCPLIDLIGAAEPGSSNAKDVLANRIPPQLSRTVADLATLPPNILSLVSDLVRALSQSSHGQDLPLGVASLTPCDDPQDAVGKRALKS
ncbi:helix-turn-helix domain-containing protein [Aureimonas sp. AU20]|uniref:helix-turn-helix domain-containing protein n=1 Tax=Aureimonas sp. AU20 TaxID=1349819 RepID=UPI0007223C42|nr:helix-turn-helix transcriptional regulator [Aureimonas sp. AU20]ALN75750.1 Cro/CI family transcriptional regulator [Aureimonas sp. AU20]